MSKEYIQIYLRELSEFNFVDFCSFTYGKLSDTEIVKILTILKNRRIIVQCRSKREAEAIKEDFGYNVTDDTEDYSEINPEVPQMFVVKYVGIIILKNIVLRCYPKYIWLKEGENYLNIDKSLKSIMKVLEKYNHRKNGRKENIYAVADTEYKSNFDYLSLVIFFLNDYMENNIYYNQKDMLAFNGQGNVSWIETVNSIDAVISDGNPVYVDFYTEEIEDDDNDYFKRLHMAILKECSEILESANLFDIFSIEGDFYFDIEIEELGDKDYIKDRIKKEMNVQFITRKLELLERMYQYIDNNDKIEKEFECSIFGTSNFYTVWEDVCQYVFASKLESRLDDTIFEHCINKNKLVSEEFTSEEIKKYGIDELWKILKHKTVKDMIRKPLWVVNKSLVCHSARKTYIPDLLQISYKNGKCHIHILDAKYRNLVLNDKTVDNAPGVEEITKQYMYHLSMRKFIDCIKADEIKITNSFLFPSNEVKSFHNCGWAEIECLSELSLPHIEAIKLPADKMLQYYLEDNTVMNITDV